MLKLMPLVRLAFLGSPIFGYGHSDGLHGQYYYFGIDEHLIYVEEVLKRLQEAGFQVNPEKCVWFAKAIEYLGSTIT
jgi:hypothetical protein